MLKEARLAMEWACGDDVGVSSKAIMHRMVGGMPNWHSYPHDPADLGRCLRLLRRLPSWRRRLGEMAAVSGPWAALVGDWDALEKCMLDEVGMDSEKGDRAPLTFVMMRRLIDAGIRSDPRVTITGMCDGRVATFNWKEAIAELVDSVEKGRQNGKVKP